ncbi:hypothetical protein PENTCL1PPCAC_895 [Pristionchus entomophagus]|uniref:Uncharacterized protein n=1 Tax=Pristionchus entomophagus TaxID=358040 RepID=A0AAV5SEX6_9BILA|nr:hypothetical protein PENTCL1PPCAC_895 [Pristionchus entomophagus]
MISLFSFINDSDRKMKPLFFPLVIILLRLSAHDSAVTDSETNFVLVRFLLSKEILIENENGKQIWEENCGKLSDDPTDPLVGLQLSEYHDVNVDLPIKRRLIDEWDEYSRHTEDSRVSNVLTTLGDYLTDMVSNHKLSPGLKAALPEELSAMNPLQVVPYACREETLGKDWALVIYTRVRYPDTDRDLHREL